MIRHGYRYFAVVDMRFFDIEDFDAELGLFGRFAEQVLPLQATPVFAVDRELDPVEQPRDNG